MELSMHMLLLTAANLALVARGEEGEDKSFVEVCSSEHGTMAVSPSKSHVMNLPAVFNSDGLPTAFLNHSPQFHFECVSSSDPEASLGITFSRVRSSRSFGEGGRVVKELDVNDLYSVNAVNRRNTTATCKSSNGSHICSANIIVLQMQQIPQCSVTENATLDCQASSFTDQLDIERIPEKKIIDPLGEDEPDFAHPEVKYSFYDQSAGDWQSCDEIDGEGEVVGVSTHTENSTQTIRCPIVLIGVPRPVIVRMERTSNSQLSVGLPIFNQKKDVEYAYFSVYVNSTLTVDDEEGPDSLTSTVTAVVMAAGLVVISLLTCLVCLLLAKRRKEKKEAEAGTKANFYADINLVEKDDASSVVTESTTAYERFFRDVDTADLLDLFSPEELEDIRQHSGGGEKPVSPWQYMDRSKLKLLLRRQLSGDPSKLNPELALNQQVGALSYDPRLEIDRSNFTVGRMLGSGNFGAVYVGEASGLLHAGSKTTVAVKTGRDALDVAQFSALMYEMKILTNLELHLNLVNLLGSCTGEMEEGRLWLLLEYCPHGDLKSYLVQNRELLRNSLSGVVATGTDDRIFLTWAHSVAKGMEYLASKKIMHGDLAARNVLLGGEGCGGAPTAKVGDFGLSKSMYNNTHYLKTKRNYVPWKWMALEFLNDGCFTLKSDVWSYGVVLWEMMSLGQEPYSGQTYEEAVKGIRAGNRLEMPEEVHRADWAPGLFSRVVSECWSSDPERRCSFSEVVLRLEEMLSREELAEYSRLSEEYDAMRRLMGAEAADLSKRNTLSPTSPLQFDPALPSGSYQKMFSFRGGAEAEVPSSPEAATATTAPPNGYISAVQAGQSPPGGGDVHISMPSDVSTANPTGYISVAQASSSPREANGGGDYVEREEVRGSPRRGGYISVAAAAGGEDDEDHGSSSPGGYLKMVGSSSDIKEEEEIPAQRTPPPIVAFPQQQQQQQNVPATAAAAAAAAAGRGGYVTVGGVKDMERGADIDNNASNNSVRTTPAKA